STHSETPRLIFLAPDFSMTQMALLAPDSSSIQVIRAFRSASRFSQSLLRSANAASIGRTAAAAFILAGKIFIKQGGMIGTKFTSNACAGGSSTKPISFERARATRLDKAGKSATPLFSVLLTRLAGADFFWHGFCFVADLLTSSSG